MPPQWGGGISKARGQGASPSSQESEGTLTSGLLRNIPSGAQVGALLMPIWTLVGGGRGEGWLPSGAPSPVLTATSRAPGFLWD